MFEIGVFLVLGIFLVFHAGSNNTLSVFTTKYTPGRLFTAWPASFGGSVFTLLAFGGFEGAAPLAEEARNPRQTIQRAVLLATLLIGALYVFTTHAVDVAYGPDKFAAFASETGNASWEGLARDLYGFFWFFVFLAIVNSTIANCQRRRERVQPDRLRDGPDRRLPALPGGRQPAAPLPDQQHSSWRSSSRWWSPSCSASSTRRSPRSPWSEPAW